jgi:hypothetical protein
MYFAFPGGYSAAKAPLLMRAPLSGGPPQFVFKARPASDFRCLKAPATRCVLSEWENQQLVFYALDPIRGKGQQLARQEIASGEIRNPTGSFPDGSRIALAIPEGLPARIRSCLCRRCCKNPREWLVCFSVNGMAADGKGWFVAAISRSEHASLLTPRTRTRCVKPSAATTRAIPSPTATIWLS